jgi:hypothetical protein
MLRTMRSVRFLFTGPLVLFTLFLINLATPGGWWIQWPALAIGLSWIISLFRVIRAVIVVGGLAALAAFILGRSRGTAAPVPGTGTDPRAVARIP